jgi:hypothetical protein
MRKELDKTNLPRIGTGASLCKRKALWRGRRSFMSDTVWPELYVLAFPTPDIHTPMKYWQTLPSPIPKKGLVKK